MNKISPFEYTTIESIIGMIKYAPGVQIQLIENPAIDSESYDKGLTNSADAILMVITNLTQIKPILEKINPKKKILIIFNKSDLLSENEKRKLKETLKSKYKKYDFVITSLKTKENIEEHLLYSTSIWLMYCLHYV